MPSFEIHKKTLISVLQCTVKKKVCNFYRKILYIKFCYSKDFSTKIQVYHCITVYSFTVKYCQIYDFRKWKLLITISFSEKQ